MENIKMNDWYFADFLDNKTKWYLHICQETGGVSVCPLAGPFSFSFVHVQCNVQTKSVVF